MKMIELKLFYSPAVFQLLAQSLGYNIPTIFWMNKLYIN